MAVQVEVWGGYACFSRPELKTERVSYDVMTPSAARGLLEAIYWHPGLRWKIDRIHVMAPVRFTGIRRNERKNKISCRALKEAYDGAHTVRYINTATDVQQRAALVLQDVRYVIDAHFELTERATPGDNAGKFSDMMRRRLEKGQCFHQPYFGCREFPANFRRWAGGPVPAIDETRELGLMLYDMDYSDPKNIMPVFFRAKLEQGVLQVANCEVYR